MEKAFEWSDEYLLGDEIIDNEHKYLFDIANKIIAIKDASGSHAALKEIMFELYEYVKFHFDHEEEIMRTIEYPDMEKHQAIHLGIIRSMNDILEKSQNLGDLDVNLKRLIQGWIVNHVQQQDMKMKAWQQSTPNRFSRIRATLKMRSKFLLTIMNMFNILLYKR